ncbi:unnamed protein product [Prunus armeniaca]|uniref:Uncharacterized protein n=1 Tax=Prunus armeniaca TaxID=36596 RepID=A0A6J5THC3_PRUAR|nr:unnamed protein product [Prunus armeniaca]
MGKQLLRHSRYRPWQGFRVGSGREEVQSATPALVPRQLVIFFHSLSRCFRWKLLMLGIQLAQHWVLVH